MKFLIHFASIALMMSSSTIFNFTAESSLESWRVVDDVVMGGRSAGNFELSDEGHGKFYGEVSTENNGGFSSVRFNTEAISVEGFTKVAIRLRGDGKDYQFRLKHVARDYQSYITTFSTNGEWQTIEIELSELYPSFRGRKLDMPNFDFETFRECAFLIANKRNESFELLIDWIELR